MRPTTITSAAATSLLAGLLLAPGCSKKYDHRQLGPDSPRGREVRRMLAALREAGRDGLDQTMRRDGAGGLDRQRAEALRAALAELIDARSVELATVDRFGENVFRAGFRVAAGGRERTVYFLLVAGDGRLRWAGRN